MVTGLIGGGLYWYYCIRQPETSTSATTTKQSTTSAKKATPSAQKVEVADWKVYTNKGLVFSINYPSEWSVSKEAVVEEPSAYAKQFKGSGVTIGEEKFSCNLVINWGKYYSADFSKEYNLAEWIIDWKDQLNNNPNLKELKEERILIGNNSAVKISHTSAIFLGESSTWEIYMPVKSIIIFITGNNPFGNDEKCNPYYNQMLSTFKFLD